MKSARYLKNSDNVESVILGLTHAYESIKLEEEEYGLLGEFHFVLRVRR